MQKKVGAIITGGDFQALGVLRTLARKDIPTIMLDNDLCIGKYSRFKKKFLKSPRPSDNQSYVDFIIELAKKENIHKERWVIYPNSDEIENYFLCYRWLVENERIRALLE